MVNCRKYINNEHYYYESLWALRIIDDTVEALIVGPISMSKEASKQARHMWCPMEPLQQQPI
jgi:hypothetical protein